MLSFFPPQRAWRWVSGASEGTSCPFAVLQLGVLPFSADMDTVRGMYRIPPQNCLLLLKHVQSL